MSQISMPIRIAGVAGVAFLAIWFVFLRPKSESTSQTAGSTPTATAPAGSTPGQTAPDTTPAQPISKTVPKVLPVEIRSALKSKKVIVLLFWDGKSSDDSAVLASLNGVDLRGDEVVSHVASLNDLPRYASIIEPTSVEQTPTVVVIDKHRKAQSLVGFVTTLTIDQAVAKALYGKK